MTYDVRAVNRGIPGFRYAEKKADYWETHSVTDHYVLDAPLAYRRNGIARSMLDPPRREAGREVRACSRVLAFAMLALGERFDGAGRGDGGDGMLVNEILLAAIG